MVIAELLGTVLRNVLLCCSATTMQSAQCLLCTILLLMLIRHDASEGSKSCSGRQVYTASYGVITDGSDDYPASAHCEWLIQGASTVCQ